MLKRIVDMTLSGLALLALSPLLIIVIVLIWLQDFKSPFYIAPRVGKKEKIFNMIKLRSMVVNADKSGVDSTSKSDSRITPIGHFIRKTKLDELSQLFNVFLGDMSLVGPRPNVKRETDLYTDVEKKLLTVKPGITDISSIVFSDEGDILSDKPDPDIAYNQLIRPWKSRMGLLYIENQSLKLDLQLIYLTAVAIMSKSRALKGLQKVLQKLEADSQLVEIAKRNKMLSPTPPPGANTIVTSRMVS